MHQVWSWIKYQHIGLIAIGLGLVALSLSGVIYEYKGQCNYEKVDIGLIVSLVAVVFSAIAANIIRRSVIILSLFANIAVFYYTLTQFKRGIKAEDAACDFISKQESIIFPTMENMAMFLQLI